MGLFHKKQLDWSVGPIEPDAMAMRHEGARVDSLELIESAITGAGVDRDRVDMIKALTGVWALQRALAADYFGQSNNKAAVNGLEQLSGREDYSDELFWNYLTRWGPQGIAVQQTVSERLTTDCVDLIVACLTDGSWALDLGGGDRV